MTAAALHSECPSIPARNGFQSKKGPSLALRSRTLLAQGNPAANRLDASFSRYDLNGDDVHYNRRSPAFAAQSFRN
jgi:hypothetical protein